MRKNLRTERKLMLMLLAAFLSSAPLIHAQPGGTGDLQDEPDAAVPADGGISILLAAAAVLGGGRILRSRAQKPQQEE